MAEAYEDVEEYYLRVGFRRCTYPKKGLLWMRLDLLELREATLQAAEGED